MKNAEEREDGPELHREFQRGSGNHGLYRPRLDQFIITVVGIFISAFTVVAIINYTSLTRSAIDLLQDMASSSKEAIKEFSTSAERRIQEIVEDAQPDLAYVVIPDQYEDGKLLFQGVVRINRDDGAIFYSVVLNAYYYIGIDGDYGRLMGTKILHSERLMDYRFNNQLSLYKVPEADLAREWMFYSEGRDKEGVVVTGQGDLLIRTGLSWPVKDCEEGHRQINELADNEDIGFMKLVPIFKSIKNKPTYFEFPIYIRNLSTRSCDDYRKIFSDDYEDAEKINEPGLIQEVD